MAESIRVLLDQNVPRIIAEWLRQLRPEWTVFHASDVGLAAQPDHTLFAWAQAHQAIIVTYDEDFADRRRFQNRSHSGIIRLRVWPTTIEETESALTRLLAEVPDDDLVGALVIVGRTHIRIRTRKSSE
ncbi:MAG TPA: DUF5615 family PIN-like protein [Chloroflexota bacterium]|nr:DUF5615 family PIN-like protein [Chloroflexota bacterium]